MRRWLQAIRTPSAFSSLLGALVLVGVFLRCRGMLGSAIPLWEDEASWAFRLRERDYLFRPIGFMVASNAVARLFAWSELGLRLLPWLAGVAACVLTVPFVRRAFAARSAQLLFVASFALHPVAIDLSKEFKPYSIALLAHLAALLLGLEYRRRRELRWLLAALLLVNVAPFWSQDVVFFYPALFLVLLLTAWSTRDRAQLSVVALGTAVTLATLAGLYFFSWRGLVTDVASSSEPSVWATKYNVFYDPGSGQSRLGWVLSRYADLTAFPGGWRDAWDAAARRLGLQPGLLRAALDALWLLLHVLGLAVLFAARRWIQLILFALPIATLLSFNALGFWPFGPFRTNLFLLPYFLAIVCVALDRNETDGATLGPRLRAGVAALPSLLLVLLPLALLERGWHADKESLAYTLPSRTLVAVQEALRLQAGRPPARAEVLFVDHFFCASLRYYRTLHPHNASFQRSLNGRLKPSCVNRGTGIPANARAALRRDERVWMLVGLPENPEMERLAALETGARVVAAWRSEPIALLLGVERRPKAVTAPAKPVKPAPEDAAVELAE